MFGSHVSQTRDANSCCSGIKQSNSVLCIVLRKKSRLYALVAGSCFSVHRNHGIDRRSQYVFSISCFSSVRRADRVVVLQGGRVVEQGTHEELLVAEGRYARLFQLQAERFARGDEEGEDAKEDETCAR